MRVLHVIPAVAPRYGGPSRAVLEMCTALGKRGVDTSLLTTDADGTRRLPVETGRSTVHHQIPTTFFPRRFSERFKYSHGLARWLDEHVAQFDVVHIHAVFSHSSLAAGQACRRRGVPYVVRPLGSLSPWSLGRKRWQKRLLWCLGAKRLMEDAAAVHYTTTTERALVEKTIGLERGVVIPLGVDVVGQPARLPEPDDRRPFVLALSRLHRAKRLDLLIDTFLTLQPPSDFRDWRLLVAGDGDPQYLSELRRLVETRGGSSRVELAGWLEGRAKERALEQASVLVLTSCQENFGLAAVEAMAHGVPVLVSTHVNLAPEIQAAQAGWVVPLDAQAIRRVMERILHDPAERARRGAAGRKLVESRFTWPIVAQQLEQLYRYILAG